MLHHRSAPVRVFDSALRRLVDEMFVRCEEWNGVGLAAPQVGRNLQVAVIVYEGRRFTICNPEVVSAEGEVDASEGCLSMPGNSGTVRRHERITLRYRNAQGKGRQREFEGWLSRIVQHESDHLMGSLYPDRLAPGASLEAADEEDPVEVVREHDAPRRGGPKRKAPVRAAATETEAAAQA